MKRPLVSSLASSIASLSALFVVAPGALDAQMSLDDTCVVAALNRSTRVEADGSWALPNVPSNFGQIRVRASCVENGATRSGQSPFVTLPPDGTLRVANIDFDTPRPIPARLAVRSPRALLGTAGDTVQLEATATLPDGTLADVTAPSTGTSYRSSSPAVATVDADGSVTAVASGTVLVSATNEGALGVVQITVIAAADSDGDGLPDDFEIENGLDPLDDADAQRDPDGDDLTTGDEFRRGLDPFDADTDGDGLSDGREALELGTDPLRFDTDGDGLSDSLELELGTDPLDPTSFDFGAVLTSLEIRPASFALVYDTVVGEAFLDLTVVGTLRDGSTVDLTTTARGTAYVSSDLEVCGLGVESGRVFAGRAGECTIAASNAGFAATARGIVQSFSPRFVTSVDLPGTAHAIDVEADHAFVAAGEAGLQIVDVTNRRAPVVVAGASIGAAAVDVAVRGDVAFVAAGAAGLVLADVADPSAPRVLSTLPLGGDTRSVAVAASAAAAIAVATTGDRLAVIDVSDPALPHVLGEAPTGAPARAVALSDGAVLAVVAAGTHGVEVVDLSDPALPLVRGRAATADARSVLLHGDRYAVVADASSSFTIVDLADPAQPRIVATVPRAQGGIPVDVALHAPLAFTADVGFFADDAVPIFDVSDPLLPLARQRLVLPTADAGRAIDVDATYVYLLACGGCGGSSPHSHLDIGQYRATQDRLGVPPRVALVAPRDGDPVVAGTSLQIVAEASDDVGVLAVELLVDGAVVARDETAAYSTLVTVPAGVARLRIGARAFDFAARPALAEEVEVVVTGTGVTSLAGVVTDAGGQPVAGARVVAPGAGLVGPAVVTLSASDGAFRFAELAATGTPIALAASAVLDGRKHRGGSPPIAPVLGGTTDVGVIRLAPVGTLYPGPRSHTGDTAIAMAHGELSGDDGDDLAVAHTAPAEGVAILEGRGDGRFLLRQRLPATGTAVAAGDLTGDGATDLVVANSLTSTLTTLVNAGHGGLALTSAGSAVGAFPVRVRIGDLDLDGVPDVIVANRDSDDLSLLLGNGDGTLRPQTRFAVGDSPEDLEVADFDLDGRLDAAVPRGGAAGDRVVTILRGTGDGGFVPAGSIPFSIAPLRVVASDFDHDGLPDLAIGAGRFNDSQRAFVAVGRGDGTFFLPSTTGVSLLGVSLALAPADLDGDGALDLAVARDRSPCDDVRLVRGDGEGRLLFEPATAIVDDCGLRDLAVADLDGDALPDLVSLDVEGGSTSYRGTPGGGFERPLLVTGGGNPVQVIAGHDLDRDGRRDLVVRTDSFAVRVRLGNGDGTFGDAALVSVGLFARELAVGDLDGDGDSDLVASSLDDVAALLGNGDGTFAAPILTPVTRSLNSLAPIDVTGDGVMDVVATHGGLRELVIFAGRGDGTFDARPGAPVGNGPLEAALADFDRDGLLDAAVANRLDDDVSILLGDGSGGFAEQVRYPVGDEPMSIQATDLDLDGATDLVVLNGTITASPSGSRGATVLLGNGDGSFGPPAHFATTTVPASLAVADVDLDAFPDVVMSHPSTNDLSILLGAGDGSLLAPERYRAGSAPVGLDAADLDGDGAIDLVTANRGDNGTSSVSISLHR